jgi:hypothetical protein
MKNLKSTSLKSQKDVKQKLKNVLVIFIAILFTASCKTSDDSDDPIIRKKPGLELEQSISDKRDELTENFTISGGEGGQATGRRQHTSFTFPANGIVDKNGEVVLGEIDIEIIEIYDKATMVLAKMPTNGRRENGNVETLISAGEFYINATQNGEDSGLELYINGARSVEFFVYEEGFYDNEMTIFNGVDDNCDGAGAGLQCDIVWEEDKDAQVREGEAMGPDGSFVSGYSGFINNFGWTNIDKWSNDPRPKTIINADAPEGYDGTNCNVYVSYDGEPTALALLDIYNADTGLFTEHYGQIPIGLEVHFIFVSVQDGEYVYAIQAATIGEDHLEVIGTPITGTEEELIALINDLP